MTTQGLTSEDIKTLKDLLTKANTEQLNAVVRAVKMEHNRRYDEVFGR